MGGMQTFQWAVSHPAFMDRVVPIVGSPQLTSHDLLLWTAELHALERDVLYKNGEYEGRPLLRAVLDIHELALTTPAFRSGETSRADFSAWLDGKENDDHFDWNDWRRQLEAMLAHDVAKPWNGSLEEAAKRVKAKALVAVAEHDHAVSPIPALAFAKHMGAETLVMKSPCGHFAPGCEEHGELVLRVQEFLARR
jgi:homoserine O-acetyltransferase